MEEIPSGICVPDTLVSDHPGVRGVGSASFPLEITMKINTDGNKEPKVLLATKG